MEKTTKPEFLANPIVLRSQELYEYILSTSVYPREPEPLKEIREATADNPRAFFGTSPDAGQLIAMFLKLVNAKKTIEIGVFTGYSLLLTALTIPEDGKTIAIDVDRKTYETGLPIVKRAGVEHKIDFIESQALPVLDELLKDPKNEGSFDFAFVDADKGNYWNYHERLMKLVKVGGIMIYDNTLWGGYVALPEEDVPVSKRAWRQTTIEFNISITKDPRVEIAHASVGDGILICRRVGSRFRKSVISKSVRKSLTGWHRRVKAKHGSSVALLIATATTSIDSEADETDRDDGSTSDTMEGSFSRDHDPSLSHQPASMSEKQVHEISNNDEHLEIPLSSGPNSDIHANGDGHHHDTNDGDRKDDIKNESYLLRLP